MKQLAAIALIACAVSVVRAEINLTPTYSVRVLDGCKFPQVEFHDGAKKITYELPKGWSCMSHDQHTLALNPPGKDLVSVKIKSMPAQAPLVLDDVQLNHFRETAAQLLPAESKMMAEPTITPNPLLLNAHATCEIDILFALHSQRLRMSVLFVDLGDCQLRFSLISRPADFEELHKAFRESWYSWQWADGQ
jgi:hypothetical protein